MLACVERDCQWGNSLMGITRRAEVITSISVGEKEDSGTGHVQPYHEAIMPLNEGRHPTSR
jgi:hypothetical protein